MSSSNIFDPAVLIHNLQALLPSAREDAGQDDNASATSSSSQEAQLKNPYDAIAALSHALMTAVGFRLIGLGEDHRLEVGEASSSSPSTSSSAAAGGDASELESQPQQQQSTSAKQDESLLSTKKLPKEWNARGPDTYAFRYRHNQSAMEFVLKQVRMGGRALIHALAIEDNKTATLDIQVSDYTSTSFFPYPKTAASSSSGSEPLINAYIGSARVQDLASLFKINIIQKLVPGLQKEGYTEDRSSRSGVGQGGNAGVEGVGPSGGNRHEPRRPDDYDPLRDPRFEPQPARPRYPDEGGPDRSDPFGVGRNPATIGDRDLNPLGIPPGRFGGGPPPLFGGGGDNGGGMIVGPEHPIFRDRFDPLRPGGGPPGGLPPGAVPPGARFDPIGPFGPMGPGGSRGPGQGRGRGGPLGGDPDWDDLPPPRNSDYDNMFM